jgi:hypothetical protein
MALSRPFAGSPAIPRKTQNKRSWTIVGVLPFDRGVDIRFRKDYIIDVKYKEESMTDKERKQIRIMLDEQKRRQAAKIAARNAADPKGVTKDDLKNWRQNVEDIIDRS